MKKLSIIFICIALSISPLFNIGDFSFADATGPDDIEWIPLNSQVNQSITVAVYKAYLQQRSAALRLVMGDDFEYYEKAYSEFSYNMYRVINKKYNLNLPYGQIYYYMSDNAPLQFLYTTSGLQTLDNFYVAWKDYYGINENQEINVYSGEWFEDDDGNGCFVYHVPSQNVGLGYNGSVPDSVEVGTRYLYDYTNIAANLGSKTIKYNNNTVNYYLNTNYYINQQYNIGNSSSDFYRGYIKYYLGQREYFNGEVAILKYNNAYYIGNFALGKYDGKDTYIYQCLIRLNNADAINAAASIAQGPLKDLGVAAGKAAIISTGKTGADAVNQFLKEESDETVVQEVDEPESETPTTPPVTPSNPDNPSSNSSTGLSLDNNGNFNFSMPDLNINWELDSPVINIFPFSIPFDLYRAYQKMNIEGVAPHYTGTIDLIVYEWNVDFDLSQFDDFAADIRKWILFFYVIGLIIATRSIMHIY